MEKLIEKYSTLSNSKHILIMIFLPILLFIIYYLIIYNSQIETIKKLEKTIVQQQKIRIEKRNKTKFIDSHRKKLDDLQKQLDEVHSQLPDNANIPQLISELSDKAEKIGLTIETFEPVSEKKQDLYNEIVFKVKLYGDYHKIGMFIEALGKLDRIVNVSKLSMVGPKLVNNVYVITSGFEIKTYQFIPEG